MFGKQARKRALSKWFRRRNFTLSLGIAGCLLPILIIFAMYDFVSAARAKDDQVQSAALKSELAQFVLGLREEDGLPLLNSPTQLSHTTRSFTAVSLKKSFFTYFLNRGNAKSFETGKFSWEMPKACAVDFPAESRTLADPTHTPLTIRACLALVPNEPTGRYIYFAVRYPATVVTRHIQGQPFSTSDHITLDFKGERSTRIELVFEPSTLAEARYPSQKRRFIGLHEVTAYYSDDPKRPLRSFNGQAYEHQAVDGLGILQHYVTILARLEASLVSSFGRGVEQSHVKDNPDLSAAMAIYRYVPTEDQAVRQFEIAHGSPGTALTSLEKLYTSQILSKASLEISQSALQQGSGQKILWKSESLSRLKDSGRPDVLQIISDQWANLIINVFGYKKEPVVVKQEIQGNSNLTATLTEDRVAIPDIATRSFLFLSLALVIVSVVSIVMARGLSELRRIAKIAYKLTVWPTSSETLVEYSKRRDEIGTLGWTVNLLARRGRSRNTGLLARIKREGQERNEKIRTEQEQVKSRKATLDAIGHEIKSPLQALLSKIPAGSELRKNVDRMSRAIEVLDLATTVEAAFENGKIFISAADIAKFLSTLAVNLSSEDDPIRYHGSTTEVVALFDPISLEQLLNHILDNAQRFKINGSEIDIFLTPMPATVKIDVFNRGPKIPEDQIESIFNLGTTSGMNEKNLGQGLYVARKYIVGMKGTIHAENRQDGVAFVIELPRE